MAWCFGALVEWIVISAKKRAVKIGLVNGFWGSCCQVRKRDTCFAGLVGESKLGGGKQGPDRFAEGNGLVGAILEVQLGGLALAVSRRPRENGPGHFVGDRSRIIELCKPCDKVLA